MLREMVLSEMQTKSSLEKLFFQQDGTTPLHYAFIAKDYHNQFLPERFCRTVYLLMGHRVLWDQIAKLVPVNK